MVEVALVNSLVAHSKVVCLPPYNAADIVILDGFNEWMQYFPLVMNRYSKVELKESKMNKRGRPRDVYKITLLV